MILKNSGLIIILFFCLSSCGVYSFTGAAIEGKTINIHYIDNTARNVVPIASQTFTQKLQQRILSQTSLSQVNNDATDYTIQGSITGYEVSVAAISGNETSTQNRLTITVSIDFKNRINEKANFIQSFSRFADFSATQSLQSVEQVLINDISEQLADDIFNKAFVNW